MKCNNCEYYYESKISILLPHQKVGEDIDLGVRLIECDKIKQDLIATGKGTPGMGEYTDVKSKKTSSICTIKKFNVENEYKNLIPITSKNEEIIASDWCPKKKKK